MQDKENNIMIDLETMGVHRQAPILAIGLCEFDPDTNTTGSSLYLLTNLNSNIKIGRMPDASTIYWWMRQSDAARQAIIRSENANDLPYILRCLVDWITTRCKSTDTRPIVWGNSASFDISMLEDAMQACNITAPWHYRDVQCYRTLWTQNKHIPLKRTGTAHNALDDAVTQAEHAANILHQQRQLVNDLESKTSLLTHFNKMLHDKITAEQAAWIEWQHGKGAEAGMQWIHNGLMGPGLLPDENDDWGKEAQAYYDANHSEPFPTCHCGRPSSQLWMGHGACCDEHMSVIRKKQYAQQEADSEDLCPDQK